MRISKMLFAVMGCAGFALMLNASVASAQVPVDAANPPDSEFNHLECYKVVETPKAFQYFDLVSNDTDFLPAHTLEKGCKLRLKADSLCIDTRTKNMSPVAINDTSAQCADGTPCSTDADCFVLGPQAGFCTTAARTSAYGDIPNAWDYVCYKIKCDRQSQPGPGVTATVADRFGGHFLKVRRSWKLCTPILNKNEGQ